MKLLCISGINLTTVFKIFCCFLLSNDLVLHYFFTAILVSYCDRFPCLYIPILVSLSSISRTCHWEALSWKRASFYYFQSAALSDLIASRSLSSCPWIEPYGCCSQIDPYIQCAFVGDLRFCCSEDIKKLVDPSHFLPHGVSCSNLLIFRVLGDSLSPSFDVNVVLDLGICSFIGEIQMLHCYHCHLLEVI